MAVPDTDTRIQRGQSTAAWPNTRIGVFVNLGTLPMQSYTRVSISLYHRTRHVLLCYWCARCSFLELVSTMTEDIDLLSVCPVAQAHSSTGTPLTSKERMPNARIIKGLS